MSTLPDLEAWAIFAKAAEVGSFARAAEALSLSKPTVSKAITRLEKRLHVPLFHRTTRQLVLTEHGRSVLARARALLLEGEAAERELANQADHPCGPVRMTAPMSFGILQLGPIVPAFLATYPEVELNLHLSDAVEDIMTQGYDLALRITEMADSTLRARRVCTLPRILVASPEYLARQGSPSHPNDLKDHQCVIYSNAAAAPTWTLSSATDGKWEMKPSGRFIANNAEVLIPACVAGHGIAALPLFAVRHEIEAGRLETVLPGWQVQPLDLHLVMPPTMLRPARVQVLVDFLANRLSPK